MRNITLASIVWKEGDYYLSRCLDVGISSFGKTKKDALDMLKEAVELYFEDEAFPNDDVMIKNPMIASITLQDKSRSS